MRSRRVLAPLAVLALLASGPDASARCDPGMPTGGGSTMELAPGVELYEVVREPMESGSYGIVAYSYGYAQADGDLSDASGNIHGGTFDGTVNFKVSGDATRGPSVCVNDTRAGG